jgi:hypothetical protein
VSRLAVCLSLAFAFSQLAHPAQAQPLETANPVVQASLDRIARGSPSWRAAFEAIRDTGRRAIVVTSDQVLVADPAPDGRLDRFDATVLAEVAPIPHSDSRVDVVLVVINLSLLEESHRKAQSVLSEFEADLDRILVHEIYSHAVPYLLAGHLSGRCPDPAPGERALSACSIQRENAVRAELGLGRRTSYGLDDLNLIRRTRR